MCFCIRSIIEGHPEFGMNGKMMVRVNYIFIAYTQYKTRNKLEFWCFTIMDVCTGIQYSLCLTIVTLIAYIAEWDESCGWYEEILAWMWMFLSRFLLLCLRTRCIQTWGTELSFTMLASCVQSGPTAEASNGHPVIQKLRDLFNHQTWTRTAQTRFYSCTISNDCLLQTVNNLLLSLLSR